MAAIAHCVTAPKVRYKIEPEYSPEARDANVQGTAVLELVVNEPGKATEISIVSPLGFGLAPATQTIDEQLPRISPAQLAAPQKLKPDLDLVHEQ